jgi:hypothetical protein
MLTQYRLVVERDGQTRVDSITDVYPNREVVRDYCGLHGCTGTLFSRTYQVRDGEAVNVSAWQRAELFMLGLGLERI